MIITSYVINNYKHVSVCLEEQTLGVRAITRCFLCTQPLTEDCLIPWKDTLPLDPAGSSVTVSVCLLSLPLLSFDLPRPPCPKAQHCFPGAALVKGNVMFRPIGTSQIE